MKIKRILAYIVAATALAMVFVSCAGEEEEFDEALLVGKWQKIRENGADTAAERDFWKFDADGTGSIWMESEGQAEGERPFTWTLNSSKLMMIHFVGGIPASPFSYTLTLLTGTDMKFHDISDRLEFRKVN